MCYPSSWSCFQHRRFLTSSTCFTEGSAASNCKLREGRMHLGSIQNQNWFRLVLFCFHSSLWALQIGEMHLLLDNLCFWFGWLSVLEHLWLLCTNQVGTSTAHNWSGLLILSYTVLKPFGSHFWPQLWAQVWSKWHHDWICTRDW